MVQEEAVMKLAGISAVKQICLLRVDCLSAACHGLIIGRTGNISSDYSNELYKHCYISNEFSFVE